MSCTWSMIEAWRVALTQRAAKRSGRNALGGNFSASPLHADGRIYFLNEAGETTVIEPGREYKQLAKNLVEGQTLASYAVGGHAIYLRTDTHLYRIEGK